MNKGAVLAPHSPNAAPNHGRGAAQMQNVIHRSHRPSTSAQRWALSLPRGTEQSGEAAEEGRGSEGRV
jgi:hypothetical protein